MKLSKLINIDRQVVPKWVAKYIPDLLLKSISNKDYTYLVNYYKENPNLLYNSNSIFK